MLCQFTACRVSPQAWCWSAEAVRAVAPARLGGLGDFGGAGALVDGGAKGMLPARSLGACRCADAGCVSVHAAIANPHLGLRNLHVDRRNPYVESRNLSVHDANLYVGSPMLHVGASTVYVEGRNPFVATST